MRRAEHRSVNVKRLRRGTQALPAGCVCESAGAAWAGRPAERCGAAVRGSDVAARPGVGRGLESRPRVPPAESGMEIVLFRGRRVCKGIRSNLYLLHTWYKLLLIPSHRAGGARRVRRPGIRSNLYQVRNRYMTLVPVAHLLHLASY